MKMRNANYLVANLEEKIQFGIPRCTLEDNIKMYLKTVVFVGVD